MLESSILRYTGRVDLGMYRRTAMHVPLTYSRVAFMLGDLHREESFAVLFELKSLWNHLLTRELISYNEHQELT